MAIQTCCDLSLTRKLFWTTEWKFGVVIMCCFFSVDPLDEKERFHFLFAHDEDSYVPEDECSQEPLQDKV